MRTLVVTGVSLNRVGLPYHLSYIVLFRHEIAQSQNCLKEKKSLRCFRHPALRRSCVSLTAVVREKLIEAQRQIGRVALSPLHGPQRSLQ